MTLGDDAPSTAGAGEDAGTGDDERADAPERPGHGDEDREATGPAATGRVSLGSPRSPDEPRWTRLLTPLRSEDAAFRALLAVAAVCGALAAVVLLVRGLG